MWPKWSCLISYSLVFAFLLRPLQSYSKQLNIALHAQVSPGGGSVVGSVITTDGLKAAFNLRSETSIVEVFYPYHYDGFFTVRWDLVIIEGWFMMIHEFIQLIRSHSPGVIIIFFCLDPTFPGIDILTTFDVDGYLTNSKFLVGYLIAHTGIPTEYVMLAADTFIMQPNSSTVKKWGAVYVGAGGRMLQYKPKLMSMLKGALPYGLRLHGSDWGSVPSMQSVWQGSLPRFDLSNAYSSAHVVLASVIKSQGDIGMINNRIFEALSCGAVVVSDNYTALHELAGHLVLMANNEDDVEKHLRYVLQNPDWAAERSKASRAFILKRHTWSHRVVEILDFYNHLKAEQLKISYKLSADSVERAVPSSLLTTSCTAGDKCNRRNCPKMLWIVSEKLVHHPDVVFVLEKEGFGVFCSMYNITYINFSHFKWQELQAFLENDNRTASSNSEESALCTTCSFDSVEESCSSNSCSSTGRGNTETASTLILDWLSQFDVILAVITPCDDLDRTMRMLPSGHDMHKQVDRAQKRAAYLIGLDPTLLPLSTAPPREHSNKSGNDTQNSASTLSFSHYDLLWYRSPYELMQLQHAGFTINPFRMILCFGLGGESEARNEVNTFEKAFRRSWGLGLINPVKSSRKHTDPSSSNRSEGSGSNFSKMNRRTDLPVVAVCFISHAEHCSEEARNSMMHSVVGTYKLLLIGGLWSDWLDNGACEGFSEHVERIVHVSTRQVGDAINIVETAGSVFIFHTGIARARNSNNSLLINTVNDVIWPIVLAASSDTRIHLSNPNPHLEDLVRGSNLLSEKWTSIGMAKVFSSAVVRLHGFGVNTARVNAHQICISESGNFCRLNLTAEPDCLFSTPYSPPLISTFLRNNSVLESVTVILQLGFSDFTVGRDGSCCIVYRGMTLTCLIRPFKYLIITAAAASSSSSSSSSSVSTNSSSSSSSSFSSSYSSTSPTDASSATNSATTSSISSPPSPSISSTLPVTIDHNFSEANPQKMHALPTFSLMKRVGINISLSLRGNMFRDEIYSLPYCIVAEVCCVSDEKMKSMAQLRDAFWLDIAL